MARPATPQERLQALTRSIASESLTAAGLLPADEEEGSPAPKPDTADQPSDDAPESTSEDTTAETGAEPDGDAEALVFGKYKTMEEAKQAHWELHGHASAVKQENAELRGQLATIAAKLEQLQAGKASPDVVAAAEDDAIAELETYGLPADVARRAITKLVTQTFQQMLEPAKVAGEADAYMRKNYKGYSEHFNDLVQFVQSDKETATMVANAERVGDFKTARIIAWTRFRDANAEKLEATMKRKAVEDAPARKQAKADAGVGRGNTSTPARQPGKAAGDMDRDEQARRLLAAARAGRPGARDKYIALMAGLPDNL